MSSRSLARCCFGLTALCVLAGVVLSVLTSATMAAAGLASPVARGCNVFSYFTTQSNLIVGVTCLVLALRRPRPLDTANDHSTLFRVFRLDGLVMILVTAVVFHTVLAGLLDLSGWPAVGNQLVHTVVPILALLGWLLFGPRGQISRRVVGLSVVYPILWVVFTLIRGAIGGWYPYPFLDADELGYPRVSLSILGITIAFVALAAGLLGVDRLLGRTARGRPGRHTAASAREEPVAAAPPVVGREETPEMEASRS